MEEEALVVGVVEEHPEAEGASVTEVVGEVVEEVEGGVAALALEKAEEEAGTQILLRVEAFEGVDHSMQIGSCGARVPSTTASYEITGMLFYWRVLFFNPNLYVRTPVDLIRSSK